MLIVSWYSSLPYTLTEMSEEEQFALALRMSEQEAREVNSQEEKEEELLRKAIAESLNVNIYCIEFVGFINNVLSYLVVGIVILEMSYGNL